jgi:hypothetical protein
MPRFLVSIVLVVFALPPTGQQRSRLDEPIADLQITNPIGLHPCATGLVIDQIARAAGVSAGFENTLSCVPSPRSKLSRARNRNEALSGMSARQALDHVMAAVPAFRWQEVNGVAVVRPTAAWQDATNLLNLRAAPFDVMTEDMGQAVEIMLKSVAPSMLLPQTPAGPPQLTDHSIAVAFAGGTMLDAVTALVQARGDTEWQLGYSGKDTAILVVNDLQWAGGSIFRRIAFPHEARQTFGDKRQPD